MSDREAAVRVSAARDMLDFVDRFEPGAKARVLARFPDKSRDALESAARTAWLPLVHDHWVVDGICEELGVERARECWRASVPDHVDKPLLRSFVSGMLRVVGREPARLLRVLMRGWPLIYRDCCELGVDEGDPDRPALVLDSIHPEIRRYPNYLVSWRGVFEGYAALARLSPDVAFSVDTQLTRVTARFAAAPLRAR